MYVKDLIELLETMDQDAIVILSSDPEGNGFAPLEDSSSGYFDSQRSDFYDEDEVWDAEIDGEDDSVGLRKPCVVFWPSY